MKFTKITFYILPASMLIGFTFLLPTTVFGKEQILQKAFPKSSSASVHKSAKQPQIIATADTSTPTSLLTSVADKTPDVTNTNTAVTPKKDTALNYTDLNPVPLQNTDKEEYLKQLINNVPGTEAGVQGSTAAASTETSIETTDTNTNQVTQSQKNTSTKPNISLITSKAASKKYVSLTSSSKLETLTTSAAKITEGLQTVSTLQKISFTLPAIIADFSQSFTYPGKPISPETSKKLYTFAGLLAVVGGSVLTTSSSKQKRELSGKKAVVNSTTVLSNEA